jgi:monothiol glutaredoxin
MDAQSTIKQQVTSHRGAHEGHAAVPAVHFAPQILYACGADFFSVNVLEEPEIRQGIKEYANWPTIPQLYVNGEFVGGSDILREMYQSGELQKLLAEKQKA